MYPDRVSSSLVRVAFVLKRSICFDMIRCEFHQGTLYDRWANSSIREWVLVPRSLFICYTTINIWTGDRKWFEPRSYMPPLNLIVRVNGVLRRTIGSDYAVLRTPFSGTIKFPRGISRQIKSQISRQTILLNCGSVHEWKFRIACDS